MFENPRRRSQARNFTTNVPKILDLKWSSEQIFSENCRWVPLSRELQRHARNVTIDPRYAWEILLLFSIKVEIGISSSIKVIHFNFHYYG